MHRLGEGWRKGKWSTAVGSKDGPHAENTLTDRGGRRGNTRSVESGELGLRVYSLASGWTVGW